MAEERIYTIIVNKKRIEVSQEVYKAYHKHREAERYRRGLISQIEMSLDRFLEDGVSVEYEIARTNPSIEDELIKKEDSDRLHQALTSLKAEEQLLIDELFFRGSTESALAKRLGITQQAVSSRRKTVLRKLRKKME